MSGMGIHSFTAEDSFPQRHAGEPWNPANPSQVASVDISELPLVVGHFPEEYVRTGFSIPSQFTEQAKRNAISERFQANPTACFACQRNGDIVEYNFQSGPSGEPAGEGVYA